MIPFPSARRTSAKGNTDKPRRVHLVCPICFGRFSLNYAEYRKHVVAGTRPTDSHSCGAEYLKRRKLEQALREIDRQRSQPQEVTA